MVKELREGHLYELQLYLAVASKNGIHLNCDEYINSSTIYLYLEHCPYSETHTLLSLRDEKIVYTNDEDHLLMHSKEVSYEDTQPKKYHRYYDNYYF